MKTTTTYFQAAYKCDECWLESTWRFTKQEAQNDINKWRDIGFQYPMIIRTKTVHEEEVAPDTSLELARALRREQALEQDKAKLVKALEKIANQDYRGNRSTEAQIAHEALENL